MKSSLRPTPFGMVLLISSLLLGGIGILRGELATILWGSAFLGLGMVCFIGTLVGTLLVRGRVGKGGGLLPFDGAGFTAGETLVEFWPLPVPRRLPPGILLFGELLYRCGRRVLKGLGGVELRRRGAEIRLYSPRRGAYEGAGRLVCRDALGFFQGTIPLPREGSLRIYPLVAGEERRSPPSLGGQGPASSRTPRRSRELFDLRKYAPGDDPRRIHWKLFAHLEELFLRQGEETPPPSGEFPVYLDLVAPSLAPSPLEEVFLDHLLGRFARWGEGVLEKGGELLLLGKAGQPAARFSPGEEVKFLGYLAELAWQVEAPPWNTAEYPRFFFLTTPLSEDWEGRLAKLEGPDRRKGATVLVPPPVPGGAIPPPSLATLLFRKPRGVGLPRKETVLLAKRTQSLLKRLEEEYPPGGILVL